MPENPNLFISWSGQRSRHVALKLRSWIPMVIQRTRPWMSETDIDKGKGWLGEVTDLLESVQIGIACLTPENLNSPWLLFECGAIAKQRTKGDSRLWTYLIGGLTPSQVPSPLSMFQSSVATPEDTKRMVLSVNNRLDGDRIPDAALERTIELFWSDLELAIKNLPPQDTPSVPVMTPEQMMSEILEWTRAEDRRSAEMNRARRALRESPLMEFPLLRQMIEILAPRTAQELIDQVSQWPPEQRTNVLQTIQERESATAQAATAVELESGPNPQRRLE